MSIGLPQILLVVLLVLLLFGAGRLPRLMGDMAKGIKSFKQGMKDDLDVDSDKGAERLAAQDRVKPEDKKDHAANS